MSGLEKVRQIAKKKGITGEIEYSATKTKRFKIKYNGKWVNFGQKGEHAFIDHNDVKRQKSYHARAAGIRNKAGELTYKIPGTANYYSYWLLW
jgi:hypothetical protein